LELGLHFPEKIKEIQRPPAALHNGREGTGTSLEKRNTGDDFSVRALWALT